MELLIYKHLKSISDYFEEYCNYNEKEVPEHFREPFIYSGYRNPKSSWVLCIQSLFLPTNETVNIWTHLLPAFYFIFCFHSELFNLNLVLYDYYYVPFIIYVGTIVIYTMISSLAHLFNTMSNKARHICFICDYVAVSIHAHGTALAFFAYSIPISWITRKSNEIFSNYFIILSVISCTFSVALSCYTRFQSASFRRKLIRFSAFMSPCLITISPIIIRSFHCYINENDINVQKDCNDDFYEHWIYQVLFSILAATLYISHFPERIYPGRFDIWGHSHQLFHIAGTLNTYFQMQLIKSDCLNRRIVMEEHNRLPTFSNTYAPFFIVVISNIFLSGFFIKQLRFKMKNSAE